MRYDRMDDLQAGIEIGRTNINNLRYTEDAILMAASNQGETKESLDEDEGGE